MKLPRLPIVERRSYLLDAVRGRTLLSIGLGGYADHRPYSFSLDRTDLEATLSGALAAAASSATFADLSTDAIAAFRERVGATYHHVDVTAPPMDWPADLSNRQFEVVVIGEVLEHLDNPGAALRNLHGQVVPGGRLIITVPNAYQAAWVARVLLGRESTHPEHASHYSYVTLTRLLAMNGLTASQLLWYRWARHGGSTSAQVRRGAAARLSAALPQLSHGLIAVVDR